MPCQLRCSLLSTYLLLLARRAVREDATPVCFRCLSNSIVAIRWPYVKDRCDCGRTWNQMLGSAWCYMHSMVFVLYVTRLFIHGIGSEPIPRCFEPPSSGRYAGHATAQVSQDDRKLLEAGHIVGKGTLAHLLPLCNQPLTSPWVHP